MPHQVHYHATEQAAPPVRPAVVMNPAAGNGRVGKQLQFLQDALARHVPSMTLLVTERAGHAEELVRHALREGHDRVIVVGGDGTYSEAVNGYFDGTAPVNPQAALAIVPWGTGSDLARTLGLPRGHAALAGVAGVRLIRADVGRVVLRGLYGAESMRHFINVAHAGLGGEVARRVNCASKILGGRVSYLRSVCGALIANRNRLMRLQFDDEVLELTCMDVAIANGAYDGGGMYLAPNATLDSGRLEVLCIGDVTRFAAFGQMRRMYNGTLAEHRDVLYRSVKRLHIEAEDAVPVNLDGDLCGWLAATFEVVPRVLPLICA